MKIATWLTLPADSRHGFAFGSVLMGAALMAFTANALLVKYLTAVRQVDVWLTVFIRALIGLLVALAFFQRNGQLRLARVFTRPLLITRGLMGALGLVCYYWTIPRLGVGVATLISCAYVIFAALMAAVFLKERLRFGQISWLIIALLGVALLSNAMTHFRWEEAVALLGAILAGGVVVGIRHLRKTESTATIFAAQCVYSLLLAIPLASQHFDQLHGVDFGLLVVAALTAAVGQLALTESFLFLTVAIGGAYNLTLPIWVTLAGIAFFGETLGLAQILGAALILLGCFQVIRPK